MNFWSLFDRLPCFPHCGCEPMIAGCFLCQPVNVVSSLPYFIAAIVLYLKVRNKNKEVMAWSLVLMVVGATSMVAHGTYTRLAMALDYASIIFLFTFFLFYDLTKKYRAIIVSPVYYMVLVLVLLPLDIWDQYYVCLGMFVVSLIHFIRRHSIKVLAHTGLLKSLSILMVALIFMLLDKNETLCSLKYMPYGHTIWHIGSALSAYYFGKWYFGLHEEVERNS